MIYGTLDTQANAKHLAAERAGGVGMAMLELSWQNFEPQQGFVNANYVKQQQSWLKMFQAAGVQVTLATGIYDTPSWVQKQIPGSYYADQDGNRSAQDVNFVTCQAARDAAAAYIAAIAEHFPLGQFWAIRLTSGGNAEMLYPDGGGYSGFDATSLTGTGLPPTMASNPLPPLAFPGSLTPAQAEAFARWYAGGLVDVTAWQAGLYRSLGFSGWN